MAGESRLAAFCKPRGPLSAAERDALPPSAFGLPERRAYPIVDASHAANAKARALAELRAGRLTRAEYEQIVSKADAMLDACRAGNPRGVVGPWVIFGVTAGIATAGLGGLWWWWRSKNGPPRDSELPADTPPIELEDADLPDPGTKATSYPGGGAGELAPASSWTQVPAGAGWTIRNPARSWGTPATAAALTDALVRYTQRLPGLALEGTEGTTVQVLDVSKQGGGHFSPHKSHHEGRDVDLSFGGKLTPLALPVLLRALLEDDAVQAIFLDWDVQGDVWSALDINPELDPGGLVRRELQYPLAPHSGRMRVRHWPGHAKHLHVRYRQ